MNVRRQSKKNDSETEKTDASTSATANLPLAKRASDRIIATATKVRARRRVPFNAVLLPKLSPKTNAASSNLDTGWDESTREAASGAKFSRSVVALALVPLAAVVAAAIYYGLTETRMALTSVSESEISDVSQTSGAPPATPHQEIS